jgi:hypothetical protein
MGTGIGSSRSPGHGQQAARHRGPGEVGADPFAAGPEHAFHPTEDPAGAVEQPWQEARGQFFSGQARRQLRRPAQGDLEADDHDDHARRRGESEQGHGRKERQRQDREEREAAVGTEYAGQFRQPHWPILETRGHPLQFGGERWRGSFHAASMPAGRGSGQLG